MAIECWYDKENDWKQYIVVSVKYSIRHFLFLVLYLCVLQVIRTRAYDNGFWDGIRNERHYIESWRESDRTLKRQEMKAIQDKEARYIEIIDKQREKLFNLNQEVQILTAQNSEK